MSRQYWLTRTTKRCSASEIHSTLATSCRINASLDSLLSQVGLPEFLLLSSKMGGVEMLSSLACKLRVRRHSSRKPHAVECFIITQQIRNRTDCMANAENKDVASIDIHSLSAMIVLKQDHLDDYQQVMNFFHQSLQRIERSLACQKYSCINQMCHDPL